MARTTFARLKKVRSSKSFLLPKNLSDGEMMERKIRKYAHGLSAVYVHMSFKAKYCHEVFSIKEFREACESCFRNVAINYDFGLLNIGFDMEHVHMIVELGKYSEPEVRKALKGTSGKKLLEMFPEIKRKFFWGSGLWGRQYYCYSIGSDMNVLQNYIKKQKFFMAMNDPEQMALTSYR